MRKALAVFTAFVLALALPPAIGQAYPIRFDGSEVPDYFGQHIQSVAVIQDDLYLYMGDYCVYRLDPRTGESERFCRLPTPPDGVKEYQYASLPPEQRERVGEVVSYLATDGGSLYGFSRYSGKICLVTEQNYEWLENALDLHPLGMEVQSLGFAAVVMRAGKMYALDGDNNQIVALAVGEGDARVYDLPAGRPVQSVSLYKDGQLLLLCVDPSEPPVGYSMWSLHLDTGALTKIAAEFPADAERIGAPAYGDGAVYCASSSQILRIDDTGRTTAVCENPPGYVNEIAFGWLLPDGAFVIWTDAIYIARPDAGDLGETLTIQGTLPRAPEIDEAFEKSFPGLSVTWVREEKTAAEIGETIRSGGAEADIYLLKADAAFETFLSRHYAEPLNGSPELLSMSADLYGVIQSVVTDERGTLYAYPAGFSLDMWLLNEGLWKEACGEAPPPKTYQELFDAILAHASPEDDAVFLDFFDAQGMLSAVLAAYIRQNERPEAPVSFQDPALRATLEKWSQIVALAQSGKKIAAGQEAENSVFSQRTGPYALLMGLHPDQAYQPCPPLTIRAEDPPCIPARLTVFCINPNSARKRYALAYLETAAKDRSDPYFLYGVHSGLTEPLESTKFEENMERLRQEYDDLQTQIKTALPEEEAVLKEKMENLAWKLEHPEGQRWIVSPFAMEQYRKMIGYAACFQHSRLLTAEGELIPALTELCRRHCDGMSALDGLLADLDRVAGMIWSES